MLDNHQRRPVAQPLDPADMDHQIRRLTEEPALYGRLILNAVAAYERLFVGASWYDLIATFV